MINLSTIYRSTHADKIKSFRNYCEVIQSLVIVSCTTTLHQFVFVTACTVATCCELVTVKKKMSGTDSRSQHAYIYILRPFWNRWKWYAVIALLGIGSIILIRQFIFASYFPLHQVGHNLYSEELNQDGTYLLFNVYLLGYCHSKKIKFKW